MKKINGFYIPLVFVVLYLFGSFMLYRYGCYVWPFRKDVLTYVFIILCILLYAIGYVLSIKLYNKKIANSRIYFSAKRTLLVSCIVSIVMYVPISRAYTNSWYPPIVKSLLNLKETYYELADIALARTSVRIWGFLDVFVYILLPLTLWMWDDLKIWERTVAFITALGYLMIYISSARNISVAIQMLSVFTVWLCIIFSRQEKRKIYRTTILTILYIFLVLVFFSSTMKSRTGYNDEVYANLQEVEIDADENFPDTTESFHEQEKSVKEFEEMAKRYNEQNVGQIIGIGEYKYNGLVINEEQIKNFSNVYKVFPNYTDMWSKAYVDTNDIFMQKLPPTLANIYAVGTTYITNGYHCLTVALHTPHMWTYGIGHSTFLSGYIDKIFGTNISDKTYYSRLTEDGEYPLVSKSLWPSTFVQWADDLTFIGVIFFMAMIGFFTARVWLSVIVEKNYWGVLLLGQVLLGVLFMPANNILENSGGFFVTFWSLMFLWLLSQLKSQKGTLSETEKK